MSRLTIIQPDDWHLHLRDGDKLRAVLPDTTRRFARAMVMPNLSAPVTTTEKALAYRERILAAAPRGVKFEPLMTLYLTDNTTAAEIRRARESGVVRGVKYYPAGATTNSDAGVTDLDRCSAALTAMEECDLPLLVHGEVTYPSVDVFDREKIFISRILMPLLQKYTKLRVVLEHITTREGVRFVMGTPPRVAGTITAHHLLLNRNAMFSGGLRPHHYCLPVAKREEHRQALIQAATSGNPKFFLGTDSAPHARSAKEAACGCAGIYTAHAAIELYAEAFEAANALERLEAFASMFGPQFYGLPRNRERITLVKETRKVPGAVPYDGDTLVPFRAGDAVSWTIL